MQENVIQTRSEQGTKKLAQMFTHLVTPPQLFALYGNIGCGKTTFVRGFVRAISGGSNVYVQSPTFSLLRTYPTKPKIYHIDLYRAHEREILEDYGILESLYDTESFVFIEWPEILEIPKNDAIHLHFSEISETNRMIRLQFPNKFKALSLLLHNKVLDNYTPSDIKCQEERGVEQFGSSSGS